MATNTVNNITASTATSLTSNGTTGPYSLNFEYATELDVEVFVNGVKKTRITDYTFTSASQITFTTAPANGASILIQRNTQVSSTAFIFQDGSVLSATELNNINTQLLHAIQELVDDYVKKDGSVPVRANLVFEGSTNDANETTLAITDPTADRTITIPDITGTLVTTGDTGTVTSTMINDGTIVNADINASADISGSKLADDSVTLAKLGSGALPTDITVASSNIVDGTIVNADINASAAIQGTKISPDFGSQNITTTGNGTVGGTLGVTGNSTLSGTLTITGAIDANGGAVIDNIQIGITNDNEIDTASGNLTIDSAGGTTTIDDDLTVSGNSTLNGTLEVTGTSTLANVTGGAVVTSGTSTSDTKVYSAKRAGEIFYGKDTVAEIQSGETWSSTDDKVATTAAIDARIIDFVDDVGGFDAIANETSFPTTNPQGAAGQSAILSIAAVSTTLTPNSNVITIANGAGTGNTVTINGVTPSTIPQGFGLIVESTSTLHTYNFHRLVPKATEVSTVAGIASNVTTVAGISANVTTVAGISSNVTSVAGNASNINAAVSNASNINSVAGNETNINSAVSNATNINTVAGSISNVNTVAGSISSVNTASSNINSIANFGDQYQVASSNPSTDGGGNALAAGDLYFNTTANELKVYTGSAWQGGVTASGNFAATTGNNFTGDNVYADNAKAIFGTGQDLKIHHSSNQSTIEEVSGSLNITSNGALSFNPSGSNVVTLVGNSTKGSGQIKLNCEQNSHGIILKGPPHSAAASYTLTLPNSILNNGVLKTDSSGNTSFALIAEANIADDAVTANKLASNSVVSDSIVDGSIVNADINASAAIALSKLATGALPSAITIASANLVDGTIVNGDINASAAIAGTKVTPSFGSQNLSTSGTAATGALTVTGNVAVTGTVDGRDVAQDGGKLDELYGGSNTLKNTVNIADGVTATTQSASDNSTKVATTAYTDTAISNLVDSAPGTLNTLNELAAALGDDANFSTTVTNSIATKLANIVEDTSPQLGGDLDVNTKNILIGDSSDGSTDDVLKIGASADLKLYHTGTNTYIKNSTGNLYIFSSNLRIENADGSKSYIEANDGGATELYYNGSKKFETTSYGASVTGTLLASGNISLSTTGSFRGDDNAKLDLGSSNDLQIYHDGTHSYIEETQNGNLVLKTNQTGTYATIALQAGEENSLLCHKNGNVELYFDGSKKFETTSAGVTVTGALTATGDVTAFSDKTLKTDINTINDALSTVSKLRGVSYKWKENNKPSIGVIAQEVEQIIPEVVHTSEHDGKEVKSVDYGKMVGVLIEAIKELKAEVEELKGAK